MAGKITKEELHPQLSEKIEEFDAHKADNATEFTTINNKLTDLQYLPNTGTANAIVVNKRGFALTSGAYVEWQQTAANTGACTVNVTGTGVKSLLSSEGAAFASGDLPAGFYRAAYDGTSFILAGKGGGEAKVEFNNYYGLLNAPNKTNPLPTALFLAKYSVVGASVGSYALFAGGVSAGITDTVDAYDTSLVRSTPTVLSVARFQLTGVSNGSYAIFAGGSGASPTVDAYNASLVRSTPTALSQGRRALSGARVGDYALFAGGSDGSGNSVATVDAYNASLVRSTPTALSQGRQDFSGASVGNYALFAGGYNGGNIHNTVDAYNASLVRSTPTGLSVAKTNLAGASVGNYALFAGGSGSGNHNGVDAYNASLIKTTPTILSQARNSLAGASVGSYALFAGGNDSAGFINIVDAYNDLLVHSTSTSLGQPKAYLAGASVGNYALFAGGNNGGITDTVDAYDTKIKIPISVGTKYDFGNGEQTADTSVITTTSPLNGYIKYKKGVVS